MQVLSANVPNSDLGAIAAIFKNDTYLKTWLSPTSSSVSSSLSPFQDVFVEFIKWFMRVYMIWLLILLFPKQLTHNKKKNDHFIGLIYKWFLRFNVAAIQRSYPIFNQKTYGKNLTCPLPILNRPSRHIGYIVFPP